MKHIEYQIATYIGDVTRIGYQASKHFGTLRGDGGWRLTHLPSGRMVCCARTLRESRAQAAHLERMRVPWRLKTAAAKMTTRQEFSIIKKFGGIGEAKLWLVAHQRRAKRTA